MAGLPQKLGENVRDARKERGWTQEELSARTKLAVVQISRIERGKREIRLSTLIRLLDGLEVAPDVLLRGLYTGRTRR
jgi:HTH-type transcriptional regulator / antitoxin HipB